RCVAVPLRLLSLSSSQPCPGARFFFSRPACPHLRPPRSFPTRRSSDLIYRAAPLILTDVLPMFTDLGVDVLDERPYTISDEIDGDRKSTRLNSSHVSISYAVFCLKKKRSTSTGEPRRGPCGG